MPKVSRDSAEHVEDHGVVEDRHEDMDGYTVNFVSFRQDVDATPLTSASRRSLSLSAPSAARSQGPRPAKAEPQVPLDEGARDWFRPPKGQTIRAYLMQL